jgi:ABC-type antimicrobial peptide transport system permease subunit
MSDLMKRLFLIGSIAVIITGVLFAVVGTEFDDTVSMAGAGIIFIGFIFLVTGFTNKSVTETKEAKGLSILMILGCILAIIGLGTIETFGFMAMSIGGILVILSFIMWPCFCCQGGKNIQSQIVGVVSAHDNISINEVSKITGHSEDTIRKTVYDAIGKRILHGRMEGDIFLQHRHTGLPV